MPKSSCVSYVCMYHVCIICVSYVYHVYHMRIMYIIFVSCVYHMYIICMQHVCYICICTYIMCMCHMYLSPVRIRFRFPNSDSHIWAPGFRFLNSDSQIRAPRFGADSDSPTRVSTTRIPQADSLIWI